METLLGFWWGEEQRQQSLLHICWCKAEEHPERCQLQLIQSVKSFWHLFNNMHFLPGNFFCKLPETNLHVLLKSWLLDFVCVCVCVPKTVQFISLNFCLSRMWSLEDLNIYLSYQRNCRCHLRFKRRLQWLSTFHADSFIFMRMKLLSISGYLFYENQSGGVSRWTDRQVLLQIMITGGREVQIYQLFYQFLWITKLKFISLLLNWLYPVKGPTEGEGFRREFASRLQVVVRLQVVPYV